MKPYKHVRKAKGYCCIWCDGPYSKWKKKANRQMKRADKQIAKKQIQKELEASTGLEPVLTD